MKSPASAGVGKFTAPALISLLLASSLAQSGCPAETGLATVGGWAPPRPSSMDGLETRIRVLEESLPLLACGPELRALFHDIRMECSNHSAAQAAPSELIKVDKIEPGTCQAQEIGIRVYAAERDMGLTGRQRNMGTHLLSLLRHEVVYIGANGKISSRQEQRLRALAAERRLPSTRFVTIATGVDVDIRTRIVTEQLQAFGIPKSESVIDSGKRVEVSRFERPWNYRLGVSFAQMTPIDRPMGPAEPRDMDRAVFVFRTDCLSD